MPTIIQRQFGVRIVTLRTRHGWTQEQLAEHANISTQHISNIENGNRSPTLTALEKLANAFNLTLAQLFEGIPNEKRSGA